MNPFYMLSPSSNPQSDYEQAIGYLQPFYNTGIKSMNDYYNAVSGLVQNPVGFYNNIFDSYNMSPYAQYQMNTLNQQAANQAALAGNLGTPDEQVALMNQDQGIVSKDQQQYYDNVMRPYTMGLQGEQYLTGMGMRAGTEMGAQKDLEAAMAQKQSMLEMGALSSLIGGGAKMASALL